MNRNTERLIEIMEKKNMNMEYREYLKECWKEAEEIGIELGGTSNEVVKCFFSKIAKPFHYWLKEQR